MGNFDQWNDSEWPEFPLDEIDSDDFEKSLLTGLDDDDYIPVGEDPRIQRLVGQIRTGERIDVPYISKITDDLWLGGVEPYFILPREIKNAISLVEWQYRVKSGIGTYLSFPINDSVEQDLTEIESYADALNELRKDGPTLVHCQAGLNRSGMVAAIALIKDGMEPHEAVGLLRKKRSWSVLYNMHFLDFVMTRDYSLES